jgi:exopolysaccharide biosynthesis WecB/TagA/CpsF family protein
VALIVEGGLPRCAFLGVNFTALDSAQALLCVVEAARDAVFRYVVTPNVDHLVMLHGTGTEAWRREYRASVEKADLILNDSRVLARLARLGGVDLPLAPGSDLTRMLVMGAIPAGSKLALVGGSSADAAWLRTALAQCEIAHMSPPMGVRDSPELQEAIADFVEREAPDITFLAIGAPQSELVARRIAMRGRARGVALCIGASIEFLSGARRRAPRWMQRAGLEWAFRLLSEPRRLWRRYIVEGPRIFVIWYRWRRTFPAR